MDGSRDHIPNVRRPRVAIALGGGGARGIAHVLALEALDEMGIRPVAIAGTSMGAVVGAAYAAGIEGRAIRTHILRVLRNRSDVMGKLLRARVGRFADLVLRGRGNPVLLDPEICLDLFWPSGMPSRFEDLDIETIIVATDYLSRNEVAYDAGPLRPAVAGSMAIHRLLGRRRRRPARRRRDPRFGGQHPAHGGGNRCERAVLFRGQRRRVHDARGGGSRLSCLEPLGDRRGGHDAADRGRREPNR